MFEHFTDGARRILVLAQEEARNLHDSSIGPEHLLLGMLREGEGIAARALWDAGADYHGTREVIEEHGRPQTGGGSGSGPFSKATMRIMERSLRISWVQADGGIDTEHLLVALLEQEDETVEAVLAALDIAPEEVVQPVDALLAERTVLVNPVLDSPLPSALALALGDRSQRLEVLEGVLWGIDHFGEVVEVLRGSADRRAARDVLMGPPFELSRNQALGVLGLSVDSVTVERRKQVVEEIEMLRHEVSDE
ncbi:MAG TPA: Clp protease N-terminal domain-containing protein [Acidimicrobiales bacterium]|nr:Clp protease N-terminal domain-containing protein [Acidimicrobiales bacterium]